MDWLYSLSSYYCVQSGIKTNKMTKMAPMIMAAAVAITAFLLGGYNASFFERTTGLRSFSFIEFSA